MDRVDKPVESRALVSAELCLGASWAEPGNLFYGRFVVLPRIGETVQIPHHHPQCFKVVDVRHRCATPAGDKAEVKLLLQPEET